MAYHWSRCQGRSLQPKFTDLEEALKDLISRLERTYIIVDALDECEERDSILKLLQRIHG